MTMPLRSAPPPPSSSSQPSSRQTSMRHHNQSSSQQRSQSNSPLPETRKAPPPRPPPPKIAPLSKSTSNVFANLFGKSKSSNAGNPFKNPNYSSTQPFSLPPPPGAKSSHQPAAPQHQPWNQPTTNNESPVQLISFDSPPSSPMPSAKPMNLAGAPNYNIDLLSSDPFGRSSSAAQQSHNGFEDSFAASSFPGGWATSDPFSPSPTTMPLFEPSRPSNTNGSLPTTTHVIPSDFLDPLCNGKSLLPPPPVITMPTIIKPVRPSPSARVGISLIESNYSKNLYDQIPISFATATLQTTGAVNVQRLRVRQRYDNVVIVVRFVVTVVIVQRGKLCHCSVRLPGHAGG